MTIHSDAADDRPLNIVIVGAGIGGLAAAIGLRRAGHNVSVMVLSLSYQPVHTYYF